MGNKFNTPITKDEYKIYLENKHNIFIEKIHNHKDDEEWLLSNFIIEWNNINNNIKLFEENITLTQMNLIIEYLKILGDSYNSLYSMYLKFIELNDPKFNSVFESKYLVIIGFNIYLIELYKKYKNQIILDILDTLYKTAIINLKPK